MYDAPVVQEKEPTREVSGTPPTGQLGHGILPTAPPLPALVTSLDPAERLEFSRVPHAPVQRFDTRPDEQLLEAMFDHPSAMERERAAWEYGDRLSQSAVPRIVEMAAREPDPSVRWCLLWLLQKVAGDRSVDVIEPFLDTDHPEVRDWARLLIFEMTGRRSGAEERSARFDLANPLDQTLPLAIAGHARTFVPGMGWVMATLSPQWFETIMGRVMACTRVDSFERDLTIEKRIKAYHPDGSDHYEIYRFKGFTFHPEPYVTHHIYECFSNHTFYPSGKVEDASVAPIDDMGVILNRVAEPFVVPVRDPILPPSRIMPTVNPSIPLPPLRSESELPSRVVTSVRGRYMGAAYVNVERLLNAGMCIGPGEVQLCSLHHPFGGKLTNTFLCGTFKGKLSDTDGDGYLDINTEFCHSTADGRLDYNLSGSPNADPFDPFGHA